MNDDQNDAIPGFLKTWDQRHKAHAENLFGLGISIYDGPIPYSFFIEIMRRSPWEEINPVKSDAFFDALADARYEGVDRLSQELLDELQEWRRAFGDAKGHAPKLPQAIAAKITMLVVFCGSIGRPPPPSLQRLVAASYGFQPGQLAHEIQRECGIAPGIDSLEGFLLAATLDGLADEQDHELSVAELARKVGASRKSIRRWREMPEYLTRRRWVSQEEYWQDPDPKIRQAAHRWTAGIREGLQRRRPELFSED